MNSVVLLGAGASHGSDDVTSDTPPLGNGEDGLFARLEEQGGVAFSLPDKLKRLFRDDFEKGMSAYLKYAHGDTTQFQRELAAYLLRFKPRPTNAYKHLLLTLGVNHIVYVTLNYDLLFEESAAAVRLSIRYDLCRKESFARLLKIHGSCNFWPKLNENQYVGCSFQGCETDVEAPVLRLTREASERRCADGNSIAPVMAIYCEGKTVKVCPAEIKRLQCLWLSTVADATHVFISGVRVHVTDTHVWQPLAETKAQVTYFGFLSDKPEFDAWKATSKKQNAYFMEANFKECVDIIKSRLS